MTDRYAVLENEVSASVISSAAPEGSQIPFESYLAVGAPGKELVPMYSLREDSGSYIPRQGDTAVADRRDRRVQCLPVHNPAVRQIRQSLLDH